MKKFNIELIVENIVGVLCPTLLIILFSIFAFPDKKPIVPISAQAANAAQQQPRANIQQPQDNTVLPTPLENASEAIPLDPIKKHKKPDNRIQVSFVPQADIDTLNKQNKQNIENRRKAAEEKKRKIEKEKIRKAELARKKRVAEKKRKTEIAKKIADEAKKKADVKAAKIAADKKKADVAKKKADAKAAKIAADKKKADVAKKKADAKAAKIAADKKKADVAKKKADAKAAAKKQAQAAERKRLADEIAASISDLDAKEAIEAEASAKLLAIQQGQKAIIRKINSKWTAPANLPRRLSVKLAIKLSPKGSVIGRPRVLKSSGYPAFDSSAIEAIKRTSPLPLPKKREWANEFTKEDLILNFP